jgi:hypothetical protein
VEHWLADEIRQLVSRTRLRVEFARRLPFDAEIMVCQGREIVRLMSHDYFSDHAVPAVLVLAPPRLRV